MRRFRWYHFYIVLAVVDALVIAAGLWLHHRTIRSFESLLTGTAAFDARERDLAALHQSVMQLGAPALDVFKSRDAAAERARYRRFQLDLGTTKSRLHPRHGRMREFWDAVAQMCMAQEALLAEFERRPPEGGVVAARMVELIGHADAERRRALRLLSSEQESLLSDAAEDHVDHALHLSRQWIAEVVLAIGLIGALVGLAWYTRRLQQADEALRAERRRVEEERRERLALIGELCTGVAHGIQNPLAAIRSSTELIRDLGTMDADSRGRAEDVLSECVRLSHRVRRLLNFARAAEPLRIRVDVAEVVGSVARELAPRFEEREIGVVCRFEQRDLVVEADPDELASVFLELLSNALDHTPSGGRVQVTGLAEGDHVVIRVRDSGPGVPSGTAGHIFDLFFTTKEGGTGVGLAWARRIVDALRGSLELEPTSGSGATFCVRLHRCKSSPRLPEQPSPPRAAEPAGRFA